MKNKFRGSYKVFRNKPSKIFPYDKNDKKLNPQGLNNYDFRIETQKYGVYVLRKNLRDPIYGMIFQYKNNMNVVIEIYSKDNKRRFFYSKWYHVYINYEDHLDDL